MDNFHKYRLYIAFIIFVILGLIANKSFGWNQVGHLVISDIAYSKLTDNEKIKLDNILNPLVKNLAGYNKKIFKNLPYNSSNLAKLSILPDHWRAKNFSTVMRDFKIDDDDIKQNLENLKSYDWHYYDYITKNSNNGKLLEIYNQIEANTLATKNIKAKALGMIFLAHLIEDAHQPLHTFSRNNDKGGNGFCLQAGRRGGCSYNLHQYWDSAGKYLNNKNKVVSIMQELNDLEQRITICNKHNAFTINTTGEENINHYDFIYSATVNNYPETAYYNKALDISKKQLILAGHRLSMVLKNALANSDN